MTEPNWHALGVEAAQRLREGRAGDAAELFERMAQLRPEHADTWFNLGYACRADRQYEAALDAYSEALARGVSSPEEAHINRAVILAEFLHKVPEAEAELRQAVAVNPQALTAWLNLGGIEDDLGEPAAAREAYRQALKADPRSGRALARLAAIDVHEGEHERAAKLLGDSLQQGARSAEDAAEMLFGLGAALDAGGEYSEAFQAVTEANRMAAGVRAPTGRYDRAQHERLVDALIAMPPIQSAGPWPADKTPIFICGMFRSGSTLVEQLLARHPEVTAGGELEFIPAMTREDLAPYPERLTGTSAKQFEALRDKYLEQLQRLFPDAAQVTDKRPDNFLHLALIKALFPAARIIHTVRNPLDTIVSAFFLYFGDAIRYADQVDDIVHYYTQYRRLMDHWRSQFGADVHDVDYDRLVIDPRSELEPLLAFCGLEWDEACLAQTPNEAVRTASNWQVRKPLHARSSGRWKNYARELEGARRRLADLGLL
ncbi:tetratricopeptide repeat-containing sulfotransferase family protein [Sphingomonas sp. URHD0057]|uniref:tetratricopeptide repeat-containing sulfotransferase family protein n=1 Tax=Sphingomonas sp. URHD0057 TaxID=1380389 RepID=UPI00048D0B77|nr:sulfotransferase [Sphingomonas sp. URHD0057]